MVARAFGRCMRSYSSDLAIARLPIAHMSLRFQTRPLCPAALPPPPISPLDTKGRSPIGRGGERRDNKADVRFAQREAKRRATTNGGQRPVLPAKPALGARAVPGRSLFY